MHDEDARDLVARFLAGKVDPEEEERVREQVREPGPLRRALVDTLAGQGVLEVEKSMRKEGGDESRLAPGTEPEVVRSSRR